MTYPEMESLQIGKTYRRISGPTIYPSDLVYVKHIPYEKYVGETYVFEYQKDGKTMQAHITSARMFQYELVELFQEVQK